MERLAKAQSTEIVGEDIHIAVLAFPFGTHAAPLLTLVRRLAAAQRSFRFSFLCTAKANSAAFAGHREGEFERIKPYSVWDGVAEGDEKWCRNVHVAVEYFLKATPVNFRKGIEKAEAEAGLKVSCLLTDAFLWFAGDLAAEMEVPWLAYWTAACCSLSVHVNTLLIRSTFSNSCTAVSADQTLKSIPGLSAVQTDDLPDGIIPGEFLSPIARMLHDMGQKLPTATAVILNSFQELEPPAAADLNLKLRKLLHVGPSAPPPAATTLSDENNCLSWLDRRSATSVAYVSFGSFTTPPPHEALALAQALEQSKTPFLWSLRDPSLLPGGFEERTEGFGKVVAWAPQTRVLGHDSVGVFVTHCGWNSVLESISGGVPMICRPFFGDQRLNSRMVEDTWRVGMRVKGGVLSKAAMVSALELILTREKGKKMRENMRVLKQRAMEAIGPNGSSTVNFETLLQVIKACN